ncbi:MAG: ABC transporter permease [Lachnospiraceae bacterium]|nr:ABC transporter permease [Lachnospiraceae bacterium]
MRTSYMRAVKAESLKLKRSPVWLAFFALPLISAFFGTMNYKLNTGVLKSEWYSLWSQHTLFLCYFFMPALIGTYCSYLWRLEHTRHNWNSFLTTPLPVSVLYLGKLTQAVRVSVLGNLWIFLLFYVCGRFAGIQSHFPEEALEWFLCGTLGAVVVCCVQLLLSLVIRSFAIPIGIALAGGIFGLYMTTHGYGMHYPYSLYCLGMRANNPNMEIRISTLIVNSVGFMVVFAALSVFYLRRHEITAN